MRIRIALAGETELIEHVMHPLALLAQAGQKLRELQVARYGQALDEMQSLQDDTNVAPSEAAELRGLQLSQRVSRDGHLAIARLGDTRQNMKQRRLAAAEGPVTSQSSPCAAYQSRIWSTSTPL